MNRWAHNVEIGHLIFRQEPIVVGIKPDSPYISRNYVWRFRRLHGWHLVKVINHFHGRHTICKPVGGWLDVLRGRCGN